ncbi:hypothetical protein HK44_020840 [Pseudomonas fluorescens HK44]|uniref:Uncharacterized protein n=2 Tax=Pseudomonas fluorescens TaxID=294 RepID=A0A010SU83_PSEFL|nr:hypothetical protein HK44_020840 [Pseudomonas fluorescens HK44]
MSALKGALNECQNRYGRSCLNSNDGRVTASVWKVLKHDLEGPTDNVFNLSGDRCTVTAGAPQFESCNIPDELRSLGLQINGNPQENPTRYPDEPGPVASSIPGTSAQKGVQATLLYRCAFKALAHYRTKERFSIWGTPKKGQYLVAVEPDKSPVIAAKGFGTPAYGNFSLTFSDKVTITVTEDGWSTTSLDRIENKNSLYGEVSSKDSKAGGGCVYVAGPEREQEHEKRVFDVITK